MGKKKELSMNWSPGYTPGDNWVICDICGFKKRASETALNYNNSLVCTDTCFEFRHPQEYLRHRSEKVTPDKVRAEPSEDTYQYKTADYVIVLPEAVKKPGLVVLAALFPGKTHASTASKCETGNGIGCHGHAKCPGEPGCLAVKKHGHALRGHGTRLASCAFAFGYGPPTIFRKDR